MLLAVTSPAATRAPRSSAAQLAGAASLGLAALPAAAGAWLGLLPGAAGIARGCARRARVRLLRAMRGPRPARGAGRQMRDRARGARGRQRSRPSRPRRARRVRQRPEPTRRARRSARRARSTSTRASRSARTSGCEPAVADARALGSGARPFLSDGGAVVWFDAREPDGRRQVHRLERATGARRAAGRAASPATTGGRGSRRTASTRRLRDRSLRERAFEPINWELELASALAAQPGRSRRLTYDPGPTRYGGFAPGGGLLLLWSSGARGRYAVATRGAPHAATAGSCSRRRTRSSPAARRGSCRSRGRRTRARSSSLRGDPLGVQEATLVDPATGSERGARLARRARVVGGGVLRRRRAARRRDDAPGRGGRRAARRRSASSPRASPRSAPTSRHGSVSAACGSATRAASSPPSRSASTRRGATRPGSRSSPTARAVRARATERDGRGASRCASSSAAPARAERRRAAGAQRALSCACRASTTSAACSPRTGRRRARPAAAPRWRWCCAPARRRRRAPDRARPQGGDPWSGHMAFPGGRQDPTDLSAAHTAERETFEEVGLDSRRAELLGQLDDSRAATRAARAGLAISGVRLLRRGPAPLLVQPEEVQARSGCRSRGSLEPARHVDYQFRHELGALDMPGIRVGEPERPRRVGPHVPLPRELPRRSSARRSRIAGPSSRARRSAGSRQAGIIATSITRRSASRLERLAQRAGVDGVGHLDAQRHLVVRGAARARAGCATGELGDVDAALGEHPAEPATMPARSSPAASTR